MASRRGVGRVLVLLAAGAAAVWAVARVPGRATPAGVAAARAPVPADPRAPSLRVLYLGNSLTYSADLPRMIQDLARSDGVDLVYEQHTPGGKRLVDHAADATALGLLDRTGWDVVVLQEQSEWPALPEARVRAETDPAAAVLAARARAANPSVRVLFYETPAHRDGDVRVAPEAGTYAGMQERIDRTYERLAADLRGTLVPAGEAWSLARSERPEIDLYADDVHPGRAGAYLIACVFHASLFGRSPEGSSFTAGLGPAEASALQEIAWRVVRRRLASAPVAAPP